jgi:hypothetical protein
VCVCVCVCVPQVLQLLEDPGIPLEDLFNDSELSWLVEPLTHHINAKLAAGAGALAHKTRRHGRHAAELSSDDIGMEPGVRDTRSDSRSSGTPCRPPCDCGDGGGACRSKCSRSSASSQLKTQLVTVDAAAKESHTRQYSSPMHEDGYAVEGSRTRGDKAEAHAVVPSSAAVLHAAVPSSSGEDARGKGIGTAGVDAVEGACSAICCVSEVCIASRKELAQEGEGQHTLVAYGPIR